MPPPPESSTAIISLAEISDEELVAFAKKFIANYKNALDEGRAGGPVNVLTLEQARLLFEGLEIGVKGNDPLIVRAFAGSLGDLFEEMLATAQPPNPPPEILEPPGAPET